MVAAPMVPETGVPRNPRLVTAIEVVLVTVVISQKPTLGAAPSLIWTSWPTIGQLAATIVKVTGVPAAGIEKVDTVVDGELAAEAPVRLE